MAEFLADTSGTDALATLANKEGLFVGYGVTVTATAGTAITSADGPSSGHAATVVGTVFGASNGITLGRNMSDHDQKLGVWAYGKVKGGAHIGAEVFGSHSTINNAGKISGYEAGVHLLSGTGGASSINNMGVIKATGFGIYSINESGQTLTVTNSGTIKGGSISFFEGSDGSADKLINTGSMKGGVQFANGNDIYDGRKGHVSGAVFGQGGNDKLYGGSEANTLDGGKGNDKLFGGLGSDAFQFANELNGKTNVDTILDFANVSGNDDRFLLNDYVFQGLKDGWLSSSAFQDIAKHAEDASDRILYNSKTGDLFFDHDGKGGDHAVKFAHMDDGHGLHPTLTHADFFCYVD